RGRRRAAVAESRLQRIVISPQRLSRAVDAIVDGPTGLRLVAVRKNRPVVVPPRDVANLLLARRQIDDWTAAYRADAQEPSFGVRDPQSIGRDGAGGIAVPDRAELMGIGHPGQTPRLRFRRQTERHKSYDDAGENEREKERHLSRCALHAPILIR